MISILILEDNIDLSHLYAMSLNDAGFQVAIAATLDEARFLLNREPFDIFVCDMQVGAEYGIDLIKEEHQRLIGGHIATIVVSAQEQYRRICEAIGVEFFISKPIDLPTLIQLIRRLANPSHES